MSIVFKELTKSEIPDIKIVASYMPSYFQNIYTFAEVLVQDSKCYYYGAYIGDELVGVGNLRTVTPSFAWIERVRVLPTHQNKGVGTALFSHGVETSKENGFLVVAFATDINNKGSCGIGEKLGFKLITAMNPLWIESEKLNVRSEFGSQKPLPLEKAFQLMKAVPSGPKDEICIGWKFIPLDKNYFRQQPDMKFYASSDTILLEYTDRNPITNEISTIKAIIYGSKVGAKELLADFLRRNSSQKNLRCFIGDSLAGVALDLGFERAMDEIDSPNKVVLWKKVLD